MSIETAVGIIAGKTACADSVKYNEAWRRIFGFALHECKKHAGCNCPDDSRCEHEILDRAQEVCIKIQKELGTLCECGAPAKYISEMCRNKVTDAHRHRNRDRRGGKYPHEPYIEYAESDQEDPGSVPSQIHKRQSSINIDIGLEFDFGNLVKSGQMTEQEMKIAMQYFVAGNSLNEIATELGLAKSAVHRKLHGIVAVLRRAI